jgi:hypothetical protein
MGKKSKRVIAIYLPQFHPIKENDKWWGAGFTEWTNVSKSKPRFPGHYQPRIPADLGFYDLRLSASREFQAELAAQYGISGFCYYHYWFNGKVLLEKPITDVLTLRKPDFPFMLCWANENWSRTWEGLDKEILIKQEYSEEDDLAHIKYLIPYFKDPRYIRVDGKPVFSIYNSADIKNIERTIEIWQKEAKKNNMEIYFCRFEGKGTVGEKYMKNSFDAAIEFQPDFSLLKRKMLLSKIVNRLSENLLKKKTIPYFMSYKKLVLMSIKRGQPNYKRFPCVTPSFDNSSRKRDSLIFYGSTPVLFKKWFMHVYSKFIPFSNDENFVFINAWNEWAEGNHLEPDLKFGRQYLEAIKEVIDEQNLNN